MARFTTERGLDRLVNFSDATVAIALTLLVLPLADLAGEAGKDGLGPVLADHVTAILSFLLSFLVIAVMWLDHHALFEWLVDYDWLLVVLNLLWLLAVVLLPFSTKALETAPSADRVAVAVYDGTLFLGFAMSTAMRFVTAARPRLIHPERRTEIVRLAPSIVMAAFSAAAFVVALVIPSFGLRALILIPVARLITSLWQRKRRAPSSRSVASRTR